MMAIYESGSRPLAGTEFLIMLVLRFPASGTMKQAPSGQNTQSLRNHLTFFNWWRRHPQTCTRAYGAAPGGITPWRYTSLRYVHGGQINRDGISWSSSCAKNSIYCKEFQWLLLFRMWYMLFSIPTPIVCHCCYYRQPVFLSYPGSISARQPNLTAGGRTIRNYVWTPRRGLTGGCSILKLLGSFCSGGMIFLCGHRHLWKFPLQVSMNGCRGAKGVGCRGCVGCCPAHRSPNPIFSRSSFFKGWPPLFGPCALWFTPTVSPRWFELGSIFCVFSSTPPLGDGCCVLGWLCCLIFRNLT